MKWVRCKSKTQSNTGERRITKYKRPVRRREEHRKEKRREQKIRMMKKRSAINAFLLISSLNPQQYRGNEFNSRENKMRKRLEQHIAQMCQNFGSSEEACRALLLCVEMESFNSCKRVIKNESIFFTCN